MGYLTKETTLSGWEGEVYSLNYQEHTWLDETYFKKSELMDTVA